MEVDGLSLFLLPIPFLLPAGTKVRSTFLGLGCPVLPIAVSKKTATHTFSSVSDGPAFFRVGRRLSLGNFSFFAVPLAPAARPTPPSRTPPFFQVAE